VTTRTDGGHTIIDIVFRPDRSAQWRCTNFNRDRTFGPCIGTGADTGVWFTRPDAFCYQWLSPRGTRERCFALMRAGSDFLLRQVSGPASVIDGQRMVPR
jgi:hypothetical protein